MKTLLALCWRIVTICATVILIQSRGFAQCSVNAGPDITKCYGSLAALGANVSATGQTPFQYSWNNGATWNTTPTYNVTALNSGSYTVSVKDANGCISTDQISLTVLPLPTADAGLDVSICAATPTQLCGTASSPNGAITTQIWLPNGSASACINVAPVNTTIYTYTVSDVAGCQSSNTVQVTVYNSINVNAGPDQTICLNAGPIQLSGSPSGGSWSGTGVSASGLFTPTTTGVFTLTYTKVSSQGCSYSDTMVMTVINPSPPNGGADQIVCVGSPSFQLPNVGTWSGTPLVTSSGWFSPTAVGNYNLTVSAISGGCTVTDNVTVQVMALPSVNAGPDQNICTGQSAQLSGTASSAGGTITNIAWGGSWVSNSAILNPTANPPSTSTYTLHVTDNNNCTASDQMTVFVNSYPTVNAGADQTICSNAAPIQLSGFTPTGGTWSGAGVSASGLFTPGAVGNVTLTYSFTNAAGCTASDTKVMTVIAPNVINAGADQNVCLNAAPIQLQSGGTWSGSPWVSPSGVFTPSAVGSYTLTYSAVSGQCTSSDQVVVTVLPLPTVNAGADVSICTGQVAMLNALATSPNGSINSYSWSGGSVANASQPNTTASPIVSTTYTVTVTDNASCTSSDNIAVTVHALPTVNAGNDITLCNQPIGQQLIGFSPIGGTWSGSNVSPSGVFTPGGTGNFTLNYCYTNGNGCQACDQLVVSVNPAPTINAGVDQSVCLNSTPFNLVPVTPGGTWTASAVLNSSGLFTPTIPGAHICTYTTGTGTCLVSDTKTVIVNSLPTVNAGNDVSICHGHSHYINTNVGGGASPYTYAWTNSSTLSDNDTEDVIAYPTGNSTYTITVTDANNCTASDNISINVVPLAVADFDVPDTACVNTQVTFTNNSIGAINYAWTFGNGITSSATSPSVNYNSINTYAITLSAFNSIGCESTTSGSIEIIGMPDAQFSLSLNSGCSPLVVSMNNTSTGEDMTMQWNINGSLSNAFTPESATLIATGETANCSIMLQAENMCGSDTHVETVTVYPQPHAAFNTTLSSQCSPVTTQFTNTSTGYPDSYLWDLGNGESTVASTPANVVYVTDDNSAQFTVKLYAFNQCGVDSTEEVVMVLPNTIEMNLQPSATVGCSPMFVEFNNATTGATNFYFDFDDSSTSSLVSPNHLFAQAGTYDVVFMADDGCSYDTTTVTIEVLASPTIEVFSNSISSCQDQQVEFYSTSGGDIQFITWNFGDGESSVGSSVQHTFAAANTYSVSAMAQSNNGCTATAYTLYPVHPKPHALMSVSPSLGCSPMMVCTENATSGNIQSTWNFGEGMDITANNPCHEYINTTGAPLDYEISLHVMNEFFCTDSAYQTITVQPQPLASFNLSSTESCFPLEQINTIQNTTGATSYQWIADGQAISQSESATFSFDSDGEHIVELIAYNNYGCSDTHQEIYTIHPKPIINIAATPSSGCAPLEVSFINSTQYGESYTWSFSNGSHSTQAQPTVTIHDEGLYDVQLLATSEHGCESVQFFNDMIEVFGLPTAGFSYTPDDEIIYDLDVAFADSSSGAISYHWDFGDGLVSEEPEPTHHYQTGGLFYVTQTVTNEHGCEHSQTRLVNIDNTFYIYIPNAFSPDNDGINDVFAPVMSDLQYIKEYEFIVMNRWGEIIFKTNNPEEPWTGNVRGGEYYTHNDCFTYSIRIFFNNKTLNQTHTGSINVIR